MKKRNVASGLPRRSGGVRVVGATSGLYSRIRAILESARTNISRSVNSTQVVANWLVGREIVEEEQHGHIRATYGDSVLLDISRRLQKEFGAGYSIDNLEMFRRFYVVYPDLISDALRRKYPVTSKKGTFPISDALRRKSQNRRPALLVDSSEQHALRGESCIKSRTSKPIQPGKIAVSHVIHHPMGDEFQKPGQLNPILRVVERLVGGTLRPCFVKLSTG